MQKKRLIHIFWLVLLFLPSVHAESRFNIRPQVKPGGFQFLFSTDPRYPYALQGSSDLITWTNVAWYISGATNHIFLAEPKDNNKFFRLLENPNRPPVVSLLRIPESPHIFYESPASFPISISMHDPDGSITNLVFTNQYGAILPQVNRSNDVVWLNLPFTGTYVSAVVTDNRGSATVSDALYVEVWLVPKNDDISEAVEIFGTNSFAVDVTFSEWRDPEPAGVALWWWDYDVWWKWKAPSSGESRLEFKLIHDFPFTFLNTAVSVFKEVGTNIVPVTQRERPIDINEVSFEAEEGSTYFFLTASFLTGSHQVKVKRKNFPQVEVTPTNSSWVVTFTNYVVFDVSAYKQGGRITKVEFYDEWNSNSQWLPPVPFVLTNSPYQYHSPVLWNVKDLTVRAYDETGEFTEKVVVVGIQQLLLATNDLLENAVQLASTNFVRANGGTYGHWQEGEPLAFDKKGGYVWYKWGAPSTERMEIVFDSPTIGAVEIYRQTNGTNETRIASTVGSNITFSTEAGVTYAICIGMESYSPFGFSIRTTEPPVILNVLPDPANILFAGTNRLSVNAIDPNGNLSFVRIDDFSTGKVHRSWQLGNGPFDFNIPFPWSGTYNLLVKAVDTFGYFVTTQLNFTVIHRPPTNDHFEGRIIASSGSLQSWNTTGATSHATDPQFGSTSYPQSVWFEWTPNAAVSATFSWTSVLAEAFAGVYTRSTNGAFEAVAGTGSTNGFVFSAKPGVPYFLAISSSTNNSGTFRISTSPFPVGGFYIIPGWTNYYNARTPFSLDLEIFPSASWSDPSITNAEIVNLTDGTRRSTRGEKIVITNALPGGTFDFQMVLSGTNFVTYSGVKSITFPDHPPSDQFPGLTINLFILEAQLRTDNRGATRQAGEPSPFGSANHSLWYNLQSPSNAIVRVHTTATLVDTRLAVYTGPNLAGTVLVISNDDAGPGVTTSALEFQAVAGETYYIAVDSKNPWETGKMEIWVDVDPL